MVQVDSTGVYIDAQNLGRNDPDKESAIELIFENWPSDLPAVQFARIYVDPGSDNYWSSAVRRAATQKSTGPLRASDLTVHVEPVQRYGKDPGKNAADFQIVLDALEDYLLEKVSYVAIVSNDSDFVSLYYKLENIAKRQNSSGGLTPFKLITHGGAGRTERLGFLPSRNVHHVGEPSVPSRAPVNRTMGRRVGSDVQSMVAEIASWADEGRSFSSVAAYGALLRAGLVDQFDPNDEDDRQKIGMWFRREIWPFLERNGVKFGRGESGRPLMYSMPLTVQRKLRNLSPVGDRRSRRV